MFHLFVGAWLLCSLCIYCKWRHYFAKYQYPWTIGDLIMGVVFGLIGGPILLTISMLYEIPWIRKLLKKQSRI